MQLSLACLTPFPRLQPSWIWLRCQVMLQRGPRLEAAAPCSPLSLCGSLGWWKDDELPRRPPAWSPDKTKRGLHAATRQLSTMRLCAWPMLPSHLRCTAWWHLAPRHDCPGRKSGSTAFRMSCQRKCSHLQQVLRHDDGPNPCLPRLRCLGPLKLHAEPPTE